MTSNETNPRIVVATLENGFAARFEGFHAQLTLPFAGSAHSAVLGAASKLLSVRQKHRAFGKSHPAFVADELTIAYPAELRVIDPADHSNKRMAQRLKKAGVRLVPTEGLPSLTADEIAVADFGFDMLSKDSIYAAQIAQEKKMRAAARAAGRVLYWTDGSELSRCAGWAWVCSDGRTAAGPCDGNATQAERLAILEAAGDAASRGVAATIVTDHEASTVHQAKLGLPDADIDVVWARRSSTEPAKLADRLARVAANEAERVRSLGRKNAT